MNDGGKSKREAGLESLVVAGAVLALVLSGCDSPKSYHDSKYVYRAVDSPDGGSTVRLARVAGGGAAGYLFYDAYLSTNSPQGRSELVFRGYGDCDLVSECRGSKMLVIRYVGGSCSVHSFHNIWHERDAKSPESQLPQVEVVLERVSPPSNAWNQQ